MKFIRRAVFALSAIAVQAFGQAAPVVSISGTVTDLGGKPLDSVIVSLQNVKLADTTAAGGAYVLGQMPTAANRLDLQKQESVRLSGRGFVVFANRPSCLQIRLFSITGSLVADVFNGSVETGQTTVRVPEKTLGAAMVIVRCSLRGEPRSAMFFFDGKDKSVSRNFAFGPQTLSGLAKKDFQDALLATRQGYVPYSRNISSYNGVMDISMTPLTACFTVAQTAAHRGIIVVDSLIAAGSPPALDSACGKTYRVDSVSTYTIDCKRFGFYKKIISTGSCSSFRHSEYRLAAMTKPDSLHYGFAFTTSIPGLCLQDSSALNDTIALTGGFVAYHCTNTSKPGIVVPLQYLSSYTAFPFDTAVLNRVMDSVAAPLSAASLLPKATGMIVFAAPLKDTSIQVNGSCSLQTSLSNVTIVATDRIAIGPLAACSLSSLLSGTFSIYGGKVDNSVLYSSHRLFINAGSFSNTQLICDDSLACTPNADFAKPNAWIVRGKPVGVVEVKGGIWLQGPVNYTGVLIAIDESMAGNRSYSFGVKIDIGSTFTGYCATNSDLNVKKVTLTGKFWACMVRTVDDAGLLCMQYLQGVKLNRMAVPLPFPLVSTTPVHYFAVP